MHVFNQWSFFFYVARYKVISFYYKMFKEDLWIGRLKEQISISSHLDLETVVCTRGTNNPAVKTTRNHWSSLFLVQRLVPSTTTIPSPHQQKKELWQLGWRQDSILTLWYDNRKTRGFSNQASQHLLNYWSFTTATLMPRRGKRKEKYLNINNQQNLQKTVKVSMQPSTQASSSQKRLFSDFQVRNIILGFLFQQ